MCQENHCWSMSLHNQQQHRYSRCAAYVGTKHQSKRIKTNSPHQTPSNFIYFIYCFYGQSLYHISLNIFRPVFRHAQPTVNNRLTNIDFIVKKKNRHDIRLFFASSLSLFLSFSPFLFSSRFNQKLINFSFPIPLLHSKNVHTLNEFLNFDKENFDEVLLEHCKYTLTHTQCMSGDII